jgi:hypothetical protein
VPLKQKGIFDRPGMRETNHLYKKILNTAPFGTLFFAYGVCIDANQKALNLYWAVTAVS